MVRQFPGIFSGVLAATAVIAAFASVVWLVAPRSGEPARWPVRATADRSRESLRLLAPAPAPLPVLPSVAAVPSRLAPVSRAPRGATPGPAAAQRGTARLTPAATLRAPAATTPSATAPAVVPAAGPRAGRQAAPQAPAAPAGPLEPVATTVQSTSNAVGQAVTPVSPQAGAAVENAGATVANVIGGP